MNHGRTRWTLSSLLLLALLVGVSAGVGGCGTVGYYGQAVAGHWRIMRARVPVEDVLADPATPEKTRLALQRAAQARGFASAHLALPDNASYTSFVDLRREAVTWNVIATRPLSVNAEKWCFPVAGCLSYRGYFHRQDAEAYATSLRDQGLDVAVTAAGAYSSLGWFDDPLLSTMVSRGEPRLAGVVFHELAHQQLYLKGDSSFNESFATFVERQGIQDWLQRQNRPDVQRRYDAYQERREGFLSLLRELRQSLSELYAGGLSEQAKLQAKQQAFAGLRDDYQRLKASWGGYSGYDRWFEKPLNNARIAGVSTYNRWVGAFATLYADSGHDYATFYQQSAVLAALPRVERQQKLEELDARAP